MKIKRFNEDLDKEPLSGHIEKPYFEVNHDNRNEMTVDIFRAGVEFAITEDGKESVIELTYEEAKEMIKYINSKI